MAGVFRLKVGLRIFGDQLDPDVISKLLTCSPTKSHKKGDVRHSGFIERTGMWGLSIDVPDEAELDLDAAVNALLSKLNDNPDVWIEVHKHYQADIFCGLFMMEENEGFTLEASTAARLARIGLKIGFDLYAP